ncbi:SpoIIE family protein phosphatase [Pseudonocardia hierapolitana]|uniref:SpoIIE family protein phosphatase n=1 Tax=Pseudonocardia hierapolitana TaxID=1128676 RepID=UPI001BAF965F|nr:SpoIIE family protein phosphatase [Pseudonocardia hierapolitana]
MEGEAGAADEPDPRVFGDPRAIADCFDELPAAVFVFSGPDHVFTAVNRAARAMVGPHRDVVGRRCREAIPEEAGQRVAELLDDAYETGQPVSAPEWRILLDNNADGELEELYLTLTIVPVRDSGGDVVGLVSHVLDVTPAVSARRAAEAQATAFEHRYHAALDGVMSLQRSLLPERLPVLPGVELAARYLAADSEQGAGGDWFDAVPLGDGRLGLVVGDVVGSGTRATAVMGQLRAVLMELLLEGSDIPEVLARLDRFVARVPGAAATTLCLAVLDPADGRLDYICCGHPPPLVLAADGRSGYLPAGAMGPLGVVAATRPVVVQTALLQATDVLLLYTDGLVEGPDLPLCDGLDLLRGVAAGARTRGTPPMMAAAAPDRVCELTVERMTRKGHTDDVTLLAVQCTGARPEPFEAELPASPGILSPLRTQLDDWLIARGGSDEDTLAVRFAVLEAVSNVIEHAYPDDPGSVRVEGAHDDAGRICMTVSDTGQWVPPPVRPNRRDRGFALIRSCMDTVEIDRTATGTSILMDRTLSRRPVVGPDSVRPQRTAGSSKEAFHVDITEVSPPHVVVHGPIDLPSAADLHRRLQDASRGGVLPLTIDLTGVSHLASAGVQLLYQLAEQMAADGCRLRLIAPTGTAAHQVLTLTALHQLTEIVEDPEASW